jgi:hypothetical protein
MDFFRSVKRGRTVISAIILLLVSASFSFAQTAHGSLHGQVTDPSGAVVTKATVSVMTSDGQTLTADTNSKGEYQLQGLAPGSYTITAVADGFSTFQQQVTLSASENHLLNIPLEILVQKQQVQVQEQGTNVDVTAENNASSTIIRGKDLDALSDDPDQLQDDLTALAGPSAGPNGGEIYIDGFTGGQLPPKSSIREIRINQNPFSAQYDKLGYGRIEVFTKPGTDQYHGQFYVMGNDSAFNTGNPFATTFPSYSSQQYSANFGGPLSKKASFFVNADRRNIADEGVVNAFTLDNNLSPVPFSDTVSNPKTRTNLSPRIDYQLTPNNTLTARYQYTNWNQKNEGVGQFALASQAYDDVTTHHSVQISDTQVLSTNVVNETRFEYLRDEDQKTPFSTDPRLDVQQAFVSGGNEYQYGSDNQNHYEVQNYTSIVHGKHLVKFGARLRVETDGNSTTGGFNGSWVFSSLNAYQITEQGLAAGWTPDQIRVAGGGASQFSITTGTPSATANYADVGLYAEDGWRVRPNLSLDYGLRFETQNELHSPANFAPRVGLAWGLGRKGSTPKTILRAGYGIFYERLEIDEMSNLALQNGITQTQYIVNQPDFYPNLPSITSISSLPGVQLQPTIYQLAPNIRAPYVMQTAIGLERQLGRVGTIAVTYLNSRGIHQFVTVNANAPFPGTYDPNDPTNQPGVRPDPNAGNIYQYTSEGVFKQNQVITNANLRIGKMFSIFGNYTLSYANANNNGIDSFASNSYNLSLDYGRAAYDIRHRLFLGGTVSLPYAFRLNPFVVVASGRPFNITVGQDLNGDSIFNDRPSNATQGSGANVVSTPWGVFNPQPAVGYTPAAPYLGDGTTLASFNLRVSKTFGFGKKLERASNNGGGFGGPGGGGGGNSRGGTGGFRGLSGAGGPGGGMGGAPSNQRYSLTFSVSARNLFNRANLATPVGNLDSPLFGQANGLAGGPFSSQNAVRRFDLQALFSF